MAGLYHEFFIIEKGSFSPDNYEDYRHKEKVALHDDILTYFYDTLQWFNSWNPFTQQSYKGLSLYGVTILQGETLLKFKRILSHWRALFSEAPSQIVLTGGFYWIDEELENGTYERLIYDREELISLLEKLISMCEAAHGQEKEIVHFGI